MGPRRVGPAELSGVAASLAMCLCSCCHFDGGSRNEWESHFRSVPIPPEAAAAARSEAADAAGGGSGGTEGSVSKRSYTLTLDGDFTINEVTERNVGYLGADLVPLDQGTAERLGVEPFSGVLVRSVQKDGPAGRAGLAPDDVVSTFGGKDASSTDRLGWILERTKPGETVDVTYVRGRETISTKIEVGSETMVESSRTIGRKLRVFNHFDRTGLQLAELTDEVRPLILGPGSAGKRGLLVIENLPGGPAFRADVRLKDLVVKVNDAPVASIDDWTDALKTLDGGDRIAITIERGERTAEKTIVLANDAQRRWGYDILGLVEYDREPGELCFKLLWGMLYNTGAAYTVARPDEAPQNQTRWGWGSCLDLIRYRSSPRKAELRLLWLFPISFRRG